MLGWAVIFLIIAILAAVPYLGLAALPRHQLELSSCCSFCSW